MWHTDRPNPKTAAGAYLTELRSLALRQNVLSISREEKVKVSIGAKTVGTPAPLWVIGSYDEAGRANIMTAAWGGICCSEPPCVTVSLRKSRHSFESIIKREAFTVNIPNRAHIREADFAGIVSGTDTDKFEQSGLTAVRSEVVDAPYVAEFPVIIECRLVKTVELGVHIQLIGQVMDLKADKAVLGENGMPDLIKMDTIIYDSGQRNYLGMGEKFADAFSVGKPQGQPDIGH